MNPEKQYRYPGIHPFTENDRLLFFGRDEDIEKLCRQIKLEKLIVLIGKSGLGKSSLLNAGVVPMLREQNNFIAISVILGFARAEDITPSSYFINKLSQLIDNNDFLLNKIAFDSENDLINANLDESFWLVCKTLQIQNHNCPLILVLDQFEELFTANNIEINRFAYLLSSLIHGQIPQNVKNRIIHKIKTDKTAFTEEEINLLFEPLEIKIVISIRSDKMSLLNRLKTYLPQILQKTYELQPLGTDQAKEAILKPLTSQGEFISPAFGYEPVAEEKIINYISSDNKKPIETFQLQLICQFCENLMIKQEKDFPDLEKTIKEDDLGDLDTIFKGYYNAIIEQITDKIQELEVRRLIEEKMIIGGSRVPLADKVILSENKISKDLLDKLVNSRLLRSEANSVGGFSYEISHDTLVEPITTSYKIRFEKEEKLRTQLESERKLRLAQEQNEQERLQREKERIENEKKRKKQRKIIILVGSIAIVAVIALIYAVFMYFEAKEQTEIANKNKEEALDQTSKANEATKEAKTQKNIAEQKRLAAELAENNAKLEKNKAEIAKNKAERLADALMPNEAKTDPFGYFWKKGKQSLADFDYTQAYTQLLMAKEAPNLPVGMKDSAQLLYTSAEWYNRRYMAATGHFYKNEFAEAKTYFTEISNKNPADSLSLFYINACGDFKTLDMVLVEGGSFMMGNPDSTMEYTENERPVHKVTLGSFYINKYEVTNAQYARFLNEYSQKYNNRKEYMDSIPIFINLNGAYSNEMASGIDYRDGIYRVKFGYENRPVAWVSWYGANAFCQFYGLSLPTEAQWEYAALGGNKSKGTIYAGSNQMDKIGWYWDNSVGKTHPVGQLKPNELGLYDMSGNLYEWCWDWYDSYSGAEVKNPAGPIKGSGRVRRGGSWYDSAGSCRVAYRDYWGPDYSYDILGFRVVLVP